MRVGGLRGGERQAREHWERVVAGEEIRWQDIGSGTANDPMVEARREERGAAIATADPAAARRAERLMAGDSRERKMLDYVTGVADAAAIRAGTPRTPPSRPASSSVSRPGTGASAGSGARRVGAR